MNLKNNTTKVFIEEFCQYLFFFSRSQPECCLPTSFQISFLNKVQKQASELVTGTLNALCMQLFLGNWGIGSRTTPHITKIYGCSRPLYNMAYYLQITYAHPPTYFRSSLAYQQYLIKCLHHFSHMGSGAKLDVQQIQGLLFRTLWIFFFLSNIFDPCLVESMDIEPTHTQGQLYFVII